MILTVLKSSWLILPVEAPDTSRYWEACHLATFLSSPRGGRITCPAASGRSVLGNLDISTPLGFGAQVTNLVLVLLQPVLDEFSSLTKFLQPSEFNSLKRASCEASLPHAPLAPLSRDFITCLAFLHLVSCCVLSPASFLPPCCCPGVDVPTPL